MIKKKSPLKQEDPKLKPTYSNMPTSKRSGFKDRPYTATKSDSAKYREGFNDPYRLTTNTFRTAGRLEAMKTIKAMKTTKAKKSPLRQEDPKKDTLKTAVPKKEPYIPGRVSKEVRDAANVRKAAANKVLQDRFEKGAASKGMSLKEYSRYQEKIEKASKKYKPAEYGGPKSKWSGQRCPNMPS
jgi:hypothetical protein